MYSKVHLRVTKSLGHGNTRVVAYPTLIIKEMDSMVAANMARTQYLASDEFKSFGEPTRLDCLHIEGCPRDEWPQEAPAKPTDEYEEYYISGGGVIDGIAQATVRGRRKKLTAETVGVEKAPAAVPVKKAT